MTFFEPAFFKTKICFLRRVKKIEKNLPSSFDATKYIISKKVDDFFKFFHFVAYLNFDFKVYIGQNDGPP